MNINSRLEINFHQQDEASVFLENTTSGREEKFGEILLFCCVALRNIVNFGNHHPIASSLAVLLSQQIKGNLKELMNHKGPSEPKIIDYPGSQGRKRFVASLKCADDNFNFQYNAKGFGFLARGIGYYAPNSVLVLMKYLAKRRQDDKEYIEALENAAEQCGAIYLSGQLSIPNQSKIALMIAGVSYNIDDLNM